MYSDSNPDAYRVGDLGAECRNVGSHAEILDPKYPYRNLRPEILVTKCWSLEPLFGMLEPKFACGNLHVTCGMEICMEKSI